MLMLCSIVHSNSCFTRRKCVCNILEMSQVPCFFHVRDVYNIYMYLIASHIPNFSCCAHARAHYARVVCELLPMGNYCTIDIHP